MQASRSDERWAYTRGAGPSVKLCVSLSETTTAATLARMAELADVADLFEVRADFLAEPDLGALRRGATRPVLLTCRTQSEGGRWPESDAAARRLLLREAVDRGFELVDVEARAGFDDVVAAKAGRGLVLSWHDFERMPDDLDGLYARMAAQRPDVVKIAAQARSIEDLARLVDWSARRAAERAPGDPQLVALAMGPLGVASRILGGRHGAPFTFAAPTSGREAAPGQLPARVLADSYRVRSITPASRVYGVLGVDVLRSLSPAMHNRAFAALGLDAVYVPLQAESLAAFLRALPGLGLSGFSVTRPYKQEILQHLASVEPEAARAGSVNTVVVKDGRLHGSSTDGAGLLGPLSRHLDLRGRCVVVVGAGGAARAAAWALTAAGARVTILARRAEQARDAALPTGSAHAGLHRVRDFAWDALVNATPVGSGAVPGQLPVPADCLRPGGVVFDMVYEPRETPLLLAARARGCATVDGLEMLAAQAVGQLEAWTGTAPAPETLAEAAAAAIAEARA